MPPPIPKDVFIYEMGNGEQSIRLAVVMLGIEFGTSYLRILPPCSLIEYHNYFNMLLTNKREGELEHDPRTCAAEDRT